MECAPTELITVSREFGAGGSELARKLGERLGWPVLDDDVACRCAKRLHIDTAAVERVREHSPTLLARLSAALLVAPPEAPVAKNVVSMSWPGMTGLENRTARRRSRSVWPLPSSVSAAQDVNAIVHRPWAMMPGSPTDFANSASR